MDHNNGAATGQTPAAKKNKQLMIFGIVGGAVLLVAIIVVVLMLTVFGKPSQADYKAFVDQMNTVRRDYQGASRMTAGVATRPTQGNVDSAYQSFESYKKDTEKLKDMKALNDSELSDAYKQFSERNDKFMPYFDGVFSSREAIVGIGENCDNSKTSSAITGNLRTNPDSVMSEYDKALKPCQDSIKALESSKNTTLAKFGREMGETYTKLRESLSGVVDAYKSKNLSQMQSAYREMSQMGLKASQSARQFSTDMKKEVDAVDVRDQLNKLGRLAADKANNR